MAAWPGVEVAVAAARLGGAAPASNASKPPEHVAVSWYAEREALPTYTQRLLWPRLSSARHFVWIAGTRFRVSKTTFERVRDRCRPYLQLRTDFEAFTKPLAQLGQAFGNTAQALGKSVQTFADAMRRACLSVEQLKEVEHLRLTTTMDTVAAVEHVLARANR